MVGTMYLVAMRNASIAIWKHSAGVAGATIASGDSPLRPNIACSKSACSVLDGIPVLGPERCTLAITTGSSVITARPIASLFSASPGPLVPVNPSAPPNDAPMAAPMAASSSSACIVFTPKFLNRANSFRMSLAGVIG